MLNKVSSVSFFWQILCRFCGPAAVRQNSNLWIFHLSPRTRDLSPLRSNVRTGVQYKHSNF